MPRKAKDVNQGYKYAQIKTDLSIQILEGQLRPHDRIPSLNEITRKYKVSKITARRVLNDLINDGLVYASRGRGSFVADAAFQRTAQAGEMASKQLGVIFEHAAGSFMSDIITGIDEEAFNRKVQISLCLSNNSYEREAENLQRLVNQGIDQILLFMVLQNDDRAINPNIPLYLGLQEKGVNLLLLACDVPGAPIPSIVYDDYNAFRKLVAFMGGKNKRRQIYVTRVDNASTTAARLQGFKHGLLDSNLPYDERHIVRVHLQSHDTIVSDTAQTFGSLLESGLPMDAVLCSDEMIGAGVFDALERAGVAPSEWPVVGGMGSVRNLHVLRGNSYVLLEDDTRRLGREAAAVMLRNKLPTPGEMKREAFQRVIPVPLRVPKSIK